MPIKKNDIVRVRIDDFTSEGNGVAKVGNMVVFVKGAAVQDILDIKILKVKKNYAFAKIENIVQRSKDRIDEDCKVHSECGGCAFRHINYQAELKIKQKRVADALERIGGFKDLNITNIIGAEEYNFYRNKAQIPVSRNKNNELITGFYANHSHRVVNCSECKIQPEIFAKALEAVKEWIKLSKEEVYDEASGAGVIRHIYLRIAKKTGQLMVCIVANAKKLKKEDELVCILRENLPNLKSVLLNINTKNTNVILGDEYRKLYGEDYIIDELCGLRFKISAASFYQVNRDQAEKLYLVARKYADLNKDDVLLDLYCGTGTIGLTMARDVKKLIGVEVVKEAIENAIENAKINNISNAKFICGDAANIVKDIKKGADIPSVIILDPPRKGCNQSLINTVLEINPKKIVYISCDPATLARDLKIFNNGGYNVNIVTPVDLFPRTVHVECIVLMTKE